MKPVLAFINCLFVLFGAFCVTNANDSICFQQYRTGEFEGSALNTTANQQGKVLLELYDFDPASNKVHAYFGASNGLEGEAWLTGTINDQGDLYLSGKLSNFRMEIHGHLTSQGTINATYELKGTSNQEGKFDVTFQQELPSIKGTSGNDSGISDLIGAWEISGGLPPQANPATGATTGVSFVEVRLLEVLPDGQFKHLRTHEHCSGTGLARCCSQQTEQQQGTLSIQGQRLVFNITGGVSINRDYCNPALNQQSTVKQSKESFPWSLKRGSNGTNPALCLQIDANAPTCYQRQ